MLLPGKIDRAFNFLKEEKESREAQEPNKDIRIEKKDAIAMALGAFITFFPVFVVLLAIALFCLFV